MTREQKAKFDFANIPPNLPSNSIVIRDIGTDCLSVTNDAEAVVETLLRVAKRMGDEIGSNQPGLYYYDSDGRLDQLEHDGTAFVGFKPGSAQ